MGFFTGRGTIGVLALAVLLLDACADQPPPTESRWPVEPRFALGPDVITVTNATDHDVGSLRWALDQAVGGEAIEFDASLAGATIALDTTLEVPRRVIIHAPQDRGITIDAGGKARVLHVHEGAILENLTITGGKADVGAGILATGPLSVFASTISGNEAGTDAGIRGDTITLKVSTVTNNIGTQNGTAGVGYASSGRLQLFGATVSHNAGGAGIGPYGAGGSTPRVEISNSIIAGNGAQNCASTAGFVLTGKNVSDDDSCGRDASMIIADPKLGALADNGGPTMTRALDLGSPAINAGGFCGAGAADQRYVPRDPACDIGAYEFVGTVTTVAIDASALVNTRTGVAVVTGMAACPNDQSMNLTVALEQDQKVRGKPTIVRGSATIAMRCGATPGTWALSITPSDGTRFGTGPARATAQVQNTVGGSAVSASTEIQLVRARQ